MRLMTAEAMAFKDPTRPVTLDRLRRKPSHPDETLAPTPRTQGPKADRYSRTPIYASLTIGQQSPAR